MLDCLLISLNECNLPLASYSEKYLDLNVPNNLEYSLDNHPKVTSDRSDALLQRGFQNLLLEPKHTWTTLISVIVHTFLLFRQSFAIGQL